MTPTPPRTASRIGIVKHPGSHGERPREGTLGEPFGDLSSAIAGEAPREGIVEKSAGAFRLESSEVSNPPRGIRDIAERHPGVQFTPRGKSHAASGRGYVGLG